MLKTIHSQKNNATRFTAAKLLSASLLFLLTIGVASMHAQAGTVSYGSLAEGQVVHGFKTVSVYLNGDGKPMGARFVHVATGLTLDLLQIQSVPQAMISVNSFPVSDRGEPHTQEHLLVTKGNKGRGLGDFELMSLAEDSAFTGNLQTNYNFNSMAGPDTFYRALEKMLDALIHPDYTEEEVRREVRNFGVSAEGAELKLVEKGSVYNEMTSTFTNPFSILYREISILQYGLNHPLGFTAGGTPEGIRELKPENIAQFHAENYHLPNMSAIIAHPKEMPLETVLAKSDAILRQLEPAPPQRHFKTKDELPPPQGAAPGTINIVEYPSENEQQASYLLFGWPAQLNLGPQEYDLLSLFIDNLAGDDSTNLYKKLIDTKTREVDTGAQGLFSSVSADEGQPVTLWMVDMPPANITEANIKDLRARIIVELGRIASWKDGSPELLEFNGRLRDRILERRRELAKFVDTPPRFGFRNTGSRWVDHLEEISKTTGFKKSLTLKSELEAIERLLDGKQNTWRERIAQWKLASTLPYAVGARPSAGLARKQVEEGLARGNAEVARLQKEYGTSNAEETIKKYQANYDATSVKLTALKSQHSDYHFIDNPPLALDSALDFHQSTLPGGIPMVASTFENLSSATVGMALRVDDVPEDQLVSLSVLPDLMRNTGVIADGHAMSNDEMSGRIRREILSMNLDFVANYRTQRNELVITGTGNNVDESKKALGWMKLAMFSPNWTPENLPRIRDVINQSLSGYRTVMQRPEENWVTAVHNSYWRQDNEALLASSSFFTMEHNYQRMRWMLMNAATPQARTDAAVFLDELAHASNGADRAGLKTLLTAMQKKDDSAKDSPVADVPAVLKPYLDRFHALSSEASRIAVEAAKDLDQDLNEVPDDSLAVDWAAVTHEMRHDLQITPAGALAGLNAVRQRVLNTANARMFVVGSQESQRQLQKGIGELIAGLSAEKNAPVEKSKKLFINSRLQQRMPDAKNPIYVGLVSPTMQKGVFLNTVPVASYADADREALLRYLAAGLYGGHGVHSVFSQTISAGLAYSNGMRSSAYEGWLLYYAERVPELPQTLKFVIDVVKHGEPDPTLVESAIANAFANSRPANEYEERGAAMARDLADGLTPQVEERFFRAILALRKTPNLSDELFKRMPGVYSAVLPGYSPTATPAPGGIYMVIGSPHQLDLYQNYLQTSIGPDARLYRLYPRDFWIMGAKD